MSPQRDMWLTLPFGSVWFCLCPPTLPFGFGWHVGSGVFPFGWPLSEVCWWIRCSWFHFLVGFRVFLRLLCCCSVLGSRFYGSRGFAQTLCLSTSWTVSAYLRRGGLRALHFLGEAHSRGFTAPFLTMDILRLFVLVFFVSFALAFFRVRGLLVSTTQSISVFSRFTSSSLCVSPHISRLPSHSSGFCVGSCPSSSFSSCWKRRLRSCSSSRSSLLLSRCVPFSLSAGLCCQASCTAWTIPWECSSWRGCSRPSLCYARCRLCPGSAQRCPWRHYCCSSWTKSWSLRQMPWSWP